MYTAACIFLLVCLECLVRHEVTASSSTQLTKGGENVCHKEFSYNEYVYETLYRKGYINYRKCCKSFIWCTSHCMTYKTTQVSYSNSKLIQRTGESLFCCLGWARKEQVCPIPICEPPCENGVCTAPGKCDCPGFTGDRCEKDIDECAETNPPKCSQICTNFPGSYACSCKKGYTRNSNSPTDGVCKNVDECAVARKEGYELCQCAPARVDCHATCEDGPGTYSCSCNKGFNLVYNQVCTKEDECASKAVCEQRCFNDALGYVCSCYEGFKLDANNRTCSDIDECSINNGGCSQICKNTVPSYQCSCEKGYDLLNDLHSCKDQDECLLLAPCDLDHGMCYNELGSYRCRCKSGFQLDTINNKTCTNINECEGQNNCQQICQDLIGSYRCYCNIGYIMKPGSDYFCEDVDECTAGLSNCDQICENTEGSYKCTCNKGFMLAEDNKRCIGLPCDTMYPPIHGKQNCSTFNDGGECIFSCNMGFELFGGNTKRTCSFQLWSGSLPSCTPSQCPVPTPPKDGILLLPCINRFDSVCLMLCKKNYKQLGNSQVKCQLNNAKETYWNTGPTCALVSKCSTNNPCRNNGICKDLPDGTYECDCTGTYFMGQNCEYGYVSISSYPQLTKNVKSKEFVMTTKPVSAVFVSITAEFDGEILVLPKTNLTILPSVGETTFTITPLRAGLIKVSYLVGGDSTLGYHRIPDSYLFVADSESSSMLKELPSTDLMKNNCANSTLETCSNGKDITISSSCAWDGEGTKGYAGIVSEHLTYPLSLGGVQLLTNEDLAKKFSRDGVLSVDKETLSVLKYGFASCSGCTINGFTAADHKFVINRNYFARDVFNAVSGLMPWWANIVLPDGDYGFNINDVQSKYVRNDKLNQFAPVCPNFPLNFDGNYAVTVTRVAIRMIIMNSLNVFMESTYPICTAVNMCKGLTYVALPHDKSFTVQFLPKLSVTVKAIGFSMSSLMKSHCSEVWVAAYENKKQVCINAKLWMKSLMTLSLQDATLHFDGEIYSEPQDVSLVPMKRFEQNQKFAMSGKVSGSINFRVAGKNLVLHYYHNTTSVYANFGGTTSKRKRSTGTCSMCSTKGVHVSMVPSGTKFTYDYAGLILEPDKTLNVSIQAQLFYDISEGVTVGTTNFKDVTNAGSSIIRLKGAIPLLHNVIGKDPMFNDFNTQWTTAMNELVVKCEALIQMGSDNYQGVYVALQKTSVVATHALDVLSAYEKAVMEKVQSSAKNTFVAYAGRFKVTIALIKSVVLMPQVASPRVEKDNGVALSYRGKVCIFSYCFSNSIISVYDMKTAPKLCSGCWEYSDNLAAYTLVTIITKSTKLLGADIYVDSDTKIKVLISKTQDDFTMKFPARVSLYSKQHNTVITVKRSEVTFLVEDVEIVPGMKFDITARADGSLLPTWDNLNFYYSADESATSSLENTLQEKASFLIKNTSTTLQQRYLDAQNNLNKANKDKEDYGKQFDTLKEDLNGKKIDLVTKRGLFVKAQNDYYSAKQTWESYKPYKHLEFAEEQAKACNLTVCNDTCYSMDLYSICQDKINITAHETRCSQKPMVVSTTMLTSFDQMCHLTERSFKEVYTGTCKEGGQQKAAGAAIGIASGTGAIIGTMIAPGPGTAIGAVVGALVGLFSTLFSSCDTTYDVVETVRNIQKQCALSKFITVDEKFTVTSCWTQNIPIVGGYDAARVCKSELNSSCVPIMNPVCLQRNTQCAKRHDIIMQGMLKAATDFKEKYLALNNSNTEMKAMKAAFDQAFATEQEAEQQFNVIANLLQQAERLAFISEDSIRKMKSTLPFENCLLDIYKAHSTETVFLKFSSIMYKTYRPTSTDQLLNVDIVGVRSIDKTSTANILLQFTDINLSLDHAVRFIVRNYYCPSTKKRRRRSIADDFFASPFGHHNDYLPANDSPPKPTEQSVACTSSINIFTYLSHVLTTLLHATESSLNSVVTANERISELEDILSITENQELQTSELLAQIFVTKEAIKSTKASLEEFSPVKVISMWKGEMEAYTHAKILVACVDFKDCLQNSFVNLLELPTMMIVSRDDFDGKVHELNSNVKKITSGEFSNLDSLKVKASAARIALEYLQKKSAFCEGRPKVTISPSQSKEINKNTTILIKCDVISKLPVKYIWTRDNKTLLFENKATMKVFGDNSKSGSYRCNAWTRAGNTSSPPVYIKVVSTPILIEQPKDIEYFLVKKPEQRNRKEIVFVCNATGEEPLTVTWFYKPFNKSSVGRRLSNEKPVLLYNLTKINIGMSGFYYCNVSNKHGYTYSRYARLDVLQPVVPKQQLSVSFDIDVNQTEKINKTGYNATVKKLATLSNKQQVGLDLEVAGRKALKLSMNFEDHGDVSNVDDEIDMINKVSLSRKSLSEGINKCVDGFVSGGTKKTPFSIEKSAVIGFDGKRCEPGSHLHSTGYACVHCKPGSYDDEIYDCLSCRIGSYQSSFGKTTCMACPSNQVTAEIRSMSSLDCISPSLPTMNVAMLVDVSSSLSPAKHSMLNTFIRDFLEKFVANRPVSFTLITFDNTANVLYPFGRIQSLDEILKITLPSGSHNVRRTELALNKARDLFESKAADRNVLITLMSGATDAEGKLNGFQVARESTLRLQTYVQRIGIAVEPQAPKQELNLFGQSHDSRLSFGGESETVQLQTVDQLAAVILRDDCTFPRVDISVAVQTGLNLDEHIFGTIKDFVTGFMKAFTKLPVYLGVTSFGGHSDFTRPFRRFKSVDDVESLAEQLSFKHGNASVDYKKVLPFLYNEYMTENHNSFARNKLAIVISQDELSSNALGTFTRIYDNVEDIRLFNVIAAYDKQLSGGEELIEESRKRIFSFTQLTEFIARVKGIQWPEYDELLCNEELA